MTKTQVRNQAKDKAPTRFNKAAVAVLLKLIDLVKVPDWRKSDIEGFYTSPQTLTKLGFHTNLAPSTVRKALTDLQHDGIITEHGNTKLSFRINPEGLKMLKSKYIANRTCALERKILKTWRMKFARWNGLTGSFYEWPSTHPAPAADGALTCACVGFCSHPSAALAI